MAAHPSLVASLTEGASRPSLRVSRSLENLVLNPAHGIGQGQDFDDDFSRAWVVAEPPNEMPPDAYVIDAEGRMSLTVQVPRATDGDLEVKQEHLDQAARSLGKFLHLQLPDLITYIAKKRLERCEFGSKALDRDVIVRASDFELKFGCSFFLHDRASQDSAAASAAGRPPGGDACFVGGRQVTAVEVHEEITTLCDRLPLGFGSGRPESVRSVLHGQVDNIMSDIRAGEVDLGVDGTIPYPSSVNIDSDTVMIPTASDADDEGGSSSGVDVQRVCLRRQSDAPAAVVAVMPMPGMSTMRLTMMSNGFAADDEVIIESTAFAANLKRAMPTLPFRSSKTQCRADRVDTASAETCVEQVSTRLLNE